MVPIPIRSEVLKKLNINIDNITLKMKYEKIT